VEVCGEISNEVCPFKHCRFVLVVVLSHHSEKERKGKENEVGRERRKRKGERRRKGRKLTGGGASRFVRDLRPKHRRVERGTIPFGKVANLVCLEKKEKLKKNELLILLMFFFIFSRACRVLTITSQLVVVRDARSRQPNVGGISCRVVQIANLAVLAPVKRTTPFSVGKNVSKKMFSRHFGS